MFIKLSKDNRYIVINYLKWTQITICLFIAFIGFVFIFSSSLIANKTLEVWRQELKNKPKDRTDWTVATLSAVFVPTLFGFLIIVVAFIGLMGALKKHFCLSFTFSIVLTFNLLVNCSTIFQTIDSYVWSVVSFAICAISWMFALSIDTESETSDKINP